MPQPGGTEPHRPVMVREVLRYLDVTPGRVYVDCTLGCGGHAMEILRCSEPDGIVIGIDQDEDAIDIAKERLRGFGRRVFIVRENFRNVRDVVRGVGIGMVDGVLFDLGVSSLHLEDPARGFSFRHDARLDMRMDRNREVTAYDLVNTLPVAELERIFRQYGEERWAGRIARAVDRRRQVKPIETTVELAEIVKGSIPPRYRTGRIHPATRVFQALRIAVNDELENLKRGILEGTEILARGGRMVVISFHSLEDRIVKETFRGLSRGCVCPPDALRCTCGRKPSVRVLTRKVVRPSDGEIRGNPRARSARLRAIERI